MSIEILGEFSEQDQNLPAKFIYPGIYLKTDCGESASSKARTRPLLKTGILLNWKKRIFKDLFASEIRAVLEDPFIQANFDMAAIRHYLEFRFIPQPKSSFSAVRKSRNCSLPRRACRNGQNRFTDVLYGWSDWRLKFPIHPLNPDFERNHT